LHIPRDDIKELLSGSIDILIHFLELKSIDEFIEKWFNPIMSINAKESLIAKTLTFIVISEGPSFTEDPFAYLFLNTQPQHFETVREALLTIPGVLSADTVFGPYDIICPVQAKDNQDLGRLITRIHSNIPSVEVSVTGVVKFRG
jgi:hypothetical protein